MTPLIYNAYSTAALDAVLTAAGLPPTGLTPPSKPQLLAYANAKTQTLLATPRSYTLTGEGGVNAATVMSDCSTATGANLLALNVWAAANPTATQPWIDDFGTVTVLSGAQFQALGLAVQAYGASVWAIMATASGITGNTITATAQIDALAWPT